MADPMYRRIADDLRRQVEAGELAPGDQLRTEIELMEKYEASRNTVRDAIKLLITRGLVETRPGQGTFVIERIVPFVTTLTGDPETASGGEGATKVSGGEADPGYEKEVAANLRVPSASGLTVEIQIADATMAAILRVEAGSEIVSRNQERFIDGTPWSLQTSFYPMSLVDDHDATRLMRAKNIDEGTVAYLETLGIKQVGYRDIITVRTPDETETFFFRLPDDGRVSVIETRRTAFDGNGRPVRLTVSVYPADRNQFAVNVGKVPPEVADPASAGTGAPAAEDPSTIAAAGGSG